MNAIYVNHTANSYLSHNTIVRFFYVVFHFLHSSPTHEYLVVLLHKVVCVWSWCAWYMYACVQLCMRYLCVDGMCIGMCVCLYVFACIPPLCVCVCVCVCVCARARMCTGMCMYVGWESGAQLDQSSVSRPILLKSKLCPLTSANRTWTRLRPF